AQYGWRLVGREAAEYAQLGIERDLARALFRFNREAGRRLVEVEDMSRRAVDDERNAYGIRRCVLSQRGGRAPTMRVLDSVRGGDADRRSAGACEPLGEKRFEVATRSRLEGVFQVRPRGDVKTLRAPEVAQRRFEGLRAEHLAQQEKHHRRLAITDDLRRRVGARAKRGQRLVLPGRDGADVAQPRQARLARRRFALALAVRVIGHEGGEPLGPVAARVVHVHAVAPPVVQYLV